MTIPEQHLFVYGTLRRQLRHPLHRLLSDKAVFAGNGWFNGQLFDIGGYPGAVSSSKPGEQVCGELYTLSKTTAAEVLKQLDDYEGCGSGNPRPCEFIRDLEQIKTFDGSVDAWIYLYNLPIDGLRQIPGGDYLGRR